ncbi:type I restriction endonuclease, partial [Klebsiella variicola]|uniref:type I restriction endonuclease n=2 Tax=Enterobacterales TaxID=91347 RepID=UPI002B052EDC
LEAIQRLNPHLTQDKCEEALKQVTQINSPDLMVNNLSFHRLLTEGINIEVSKDGNTQGEYVWLVDFNQPDNNEFLVVNQVTIREDRKERRPDVIIYINGLPLVVIELK